MAIRICPFLENEVNRYLVSNTQHVDRVSLVHEVQEMKCTDQFVAGKEASAGAGPGTDERGQMQSSPQLLQQRAVLASLAVDPGMHCEHDNTKGSDTSRD